MALPFFGIGMKTDLSSPVATAELSKFAGILSAALDVDNSEVYLCVEVDTI